MEDRKPNPLPYRWGYFQAVIIIPFSLLMLLSIASSLIKPNNEPWYQVAVASLIAILGLPLGVGLFRKKNYALSLVYAMFGLSVLLLVIQVFLAITKFKGQYAWGEIVFAGELIVVWLFSMVYYRKRRNQLS